MKREIKVLDKGLFEKRFMDSRVHTRTMTTKEKVFGHLLGPLGMIMLVNVVNALLELYYTEQVPLDSMYGTGTYLTMTTTRTIIGTFMGLLISLAVQHTRSRQGRIRPWMLIGGMIACATATFMFWVPEGASRTHLALVWASNVLYWIVGCGLYNTSANLVALCTRSLDERTTAGFFRKISLTLISGILIGLVLTSVIYYRFLINNRNLWWKLILGTAVFAVIFVSVEYFWTRERVTEDEIARHEARNEQVTYPIKDQVKALLTDKYYLLMLFCTFTVGLIDAMKGGNVTVNYCRWVLGATAENNFQMIYTIASGVPLGIGMLSVYPLTKKLGVRRFTIIGFALALVSGIFGWIFANNPIMAIVFGFIKNLGLIPYAYITVSLFASALDNVEYRTGMRLDGMLGVAIIGIVTGLLASPFGGMYETILLGKGFDAQLAVQADNVKQWICFCFWGLDILTAIIYIVVMTFYDIDKKLPEINAALHERRKQAVIDSGEEWVEPEELERREQEEIAAEHERNRLEDLRIRCEKKGLDFEIENRKYLEKKAQTEAKKAARKKRS